MNNMKSVPSTVTFSICSLSAIHVTDLTHMTDLNRVTDLNLVTDLEHVTIPETCD